jgi:type IX secretion system PorP/SprF family membrane protein
MKKFIILVVLVVRCLAVYAQYVPNSSQSFQFASQYNPAFTGVEPYGDLRLGYRNQWTGFGANAPKFIHLAYNFRIQQPPDLTLNSLRTGASIKDVEIPNSKSMIQGLGINVFDQEVGPMSRLGGGVNYAVHYPLSKKIHLSTGLSVSVENTRLKMSEIYLGSSADPDPFYDRLVKSGVNRTDVNVRAGMLLYSSGFYLGFSYLPVIQAAIQRSGGNFAEPPYRGVVQAGVSFPISPFIDLKPSIVGLMQMNNHVMVDYSLKVFMQQGIWGGITYRDTQSGIVMVGFNLNEMLGAAYSYEVSTGALRQFSDGSHELVLAVRLNNFKRLTPQVW